MSLKSLSYAHVMTIADVWRDMGGAPEVEIGALEPLLLARRAVPYSRCCKCSDRTRFQGLDDDQWAIVRHLRRELESRRSLAHTNKLALD